MDYNMMSGAGGGMMFFAWITYVLVVIFIVMAIAALMKYIQK